MYRVSNLSGTQRVPVLKYLQATRPLPFPFVVLLFCLGCALNISIFAINCQIKWLTCKYLIFCLINIEQKLNKK